VNHDQRERAAPVRLPMAQAPDLDGRGHFDQALLSFRQLDSAWQQKAGQGLDVSAP
jgi:hypothetical protein